MFTIDPELDAHAEEARTVNAAIAEMMGGDGDGEASGSLDFTTLEGVRSAREAMAQGPLTGTRLDDVVDERTIDGPGGPVPLRVFVPDTVRGAYLDIHGGGWVVGTAAMDDEANWALAQAADLAVVSVDYRLAPEHPHPAGPDDCEAAALWLLEHADGDFGTDQLLIGGGSAGGHLAATTLLRLRDRHDAADRFSGANLVFGVYDLGLSPSQRSDGDEALVLTRSSMTACYEHFLPGMDADQRRHPDLSPLYADLRDLPPALFTVGTDDILLDDTLFMAARWAAAGNDTELAVYPDSPHGFVMFPTGMAAAANRRMADWARARLDA